MENFSILKVAISICKQGAFYKKKANVITSSLNIVNIDVQYIDVMRTLMQTWAWATSGGAQFHYSVTLHRPRSRRCGGRLLSPWHLALRDTSHITHHGGELRAQLLWCKYMSPHLCFAPSDNYLILRTMWNSFSMTPLLVESPTVSISMNSFKEVLGQSWSILVSFGPSGQFRPHWAQLWLGLLYCTGVGQKWYLMVKTVTLLLETEWAMSRLWQFTWLHNCFTPSVLIPHPRNLDTRTLKCVLCDRSLVYRRVNLLLKIRWHRD